MKEIRQTIWRPKPWPGIRYRVRSRMVRHRLQIFYRLPRSTVPKFALRRKGLRP